MSPTIARLLTGLFLAHGVAASAQAAEFPERLLNKVKPVAEARVTEPARALHQSLFIADLHADALLWDRDLLQRSNTGHVDLPRLNEGNVALQVFAVVSKIPIGINIHSNSSRTDELAMLMMLQAWPPATWFNVHERAVYQAKKLLEIEQLAPDRLALIRTRRDLQSFQSAREVHPGKVAGILALEGVQPLQGDMANVERLYALGYRMMGLTHFFDNEAAGSAHGREKYGLTPFGTALINTMQKKGIVIDLAHASAKTIDDVTRLVIKPVVVSHTGVTATCPSPRNLSDDQLRAIAHTGGVIGIGFWTEAACDISPTGVARAIIHAVNTVGIDHVALGSDFNGAVTTAFDSSQIALITQALKDQGQPDDAIARIMGQNTIRVLMATLPD
jgi:membrane dipeptidase